MGTIVILVLVVAGIWFMTRKPKDDLSAMMPKTEQQVSNTQQDQTPKTQADAITASGSSDASFDADSAAIDAELKAFSTDTAAASTDVE